ncbi:hypothetical protein QZH41_015243 [Actinostola sp. cb2023]|nr:hypothetical protein QZH41_015243 [Actinostola sp. cb2023]
MEKQLEIRRPVPQNHHGLSTVSKVFFSVDIFQVVIVVVFQSIMIACGNFNAYNSLENPGMGPGRRIYMCVYMGVIVYTCFLCLFAVKQQNFVEILAFLLQNFGFVTYGLIQVYHVGYKEHPERGSNITIQHSPLLRNIALSNSLALFLLNGVFIFLSWKLYIEFGWKIYKRVRFNLSLRSIYHFYQLLSCLLKMAIMYWWMYAICNSFVLLRDHQFAMYYINLGFIPTSILYACLGYIATQREIKTLMTFFILWTVGLIGYFIYKLYGFLTDSCTGCQEFHETGKDIHDEALIHFVYLGTLNLLLLLAILGVACKVFSNFGRGLAQHFKPNPERRPRAGTDLYLRRISQYIEESVVSLTSYGSEHEELQECMRLGYQQVILTSGAPLLNSCARALASSMPNLAEPAQRARTYPIGKDRRTTDVIKTSSNGDVSLSRCKLAIIDEDDDLVNDGAGTPRNTQRKSSNCKSPMASNGQQNNDSKETPGKRGINEKCIKKKKKYGINERSASDPYKESVRTSSKDYKDQHHFNDGINVDDHDDDDVFVDRDSGFMDCLQKSRDNEDIEAKLKIRKPALTRDDKFTTTKVGTLNGRDNAPNTERLVLPLRRSNGVRNKISLFNG